jgi:hypothetical protein
VVATDWGSIAWSVVGALAGGATGAMFEQRREARADRKERREKAAETLVDVQQLLSDTSPAATSSLPSGDQRGLEQHAKELQQRRDSISRRLAILGVGHPSARVRDLFARLEMAMSTAVDWAADFVLARAGILMRMPSPELMASRAEGMEWPDSLDEAYKRSHEEATRLLDQLVKDIEQA